MDTREFLIGAQVEDSERHIGTVVRVDKPNSKVRVQWHKGYSTDEEMDRLRIVE